MILILSQRLNHRDCWVAPPDCWQRRARTPQQPGAENIWKPIMKNICFLLQSLRTFPTGNKIPRIFESFLLHFLIKIYSLETINIISWCLGQCHTETKCLSRGLNPNHALITIFEDNHCTGSRYTPPVLESEKTGVTAGRPLHTAWSTYDAVLGSSDSDKKLFLSHPRIDPLGLNTRNRTSFNEGFASAKTIKKTMTIKIKAS